ncbi:MAG: cupredoxin domain-containing protein [Usitatibacter sp.]
MSRRSRLLWMAGLPLGIVASAILAAAFAPLAADSREETFEIPKGTWARRMAGNKVDILPNEVRLTLGVKDVLVLRNRDDVPQIFGPTLMMPGQSFRLPFEVASSYQFACTAHSNGQMTVTVEPAPAAGWDRLAWRTRVFMASRGFS